MGDAFTKTKADRQEAYELTREEKLKILFRLLDHMEVIVHKDKSVELKFREGVRVTSDRDVIIMSGHEPNYAAKPNPKRPGYVYGIWENPSLDSNGQPVMKIPFIRGDTGEVEFLEAKFSDSGKLIVPFGYLVGPFQH